MNALREPLNLLFAAPGEDHHWLDASADGGLDVGASVAYEKTRPKVKGERAGGPKEESGTRLAAVTGVSGLMRAPVDTVDSYTVALNFRKHMAVDPIDDLSIDHAASYRRLVCDHDELEPLAEIPQRFEDVLKKAKLIDGLDVVVPVDIENAVPVQKHRRERHRVY